MTVVTIKKPKTQKGLSYKENLNLKIVNNCLEAAQLDNKINRLEKIKIDIDSFFCYKKTQ